jgi:hypothetical protein
MKAPTFIPANPMTHHDALIAINVEYLSWLAAEGEAYFGIKAIVLPKVQWRRAGQVTH